MGYKNKLKGNGGIKHSLFDLYKESRCMLTHVVSDHFDKQLP